VTLALDEWLDGRVQTLKCCQSLRVQAWPALQEPRKKTDSKSPTVNDIASSGIQLTGAGRSFTWTGDHPQWSR
jgi:hypothetical protein